MHTTGLSEYREWASRINDTKPIKCVRMIKPRAGSTGRDLEYWDEEKVVVVGLAVASTPESVSITPASIHSLIPRNIMAALIISALGKNMPIFIKDSGVDRI